MFYEAQLKLLCDTFRKCRIQTVITDMAMLCDKQQDGALDTAFSDGGEPVFLPRPVIPDIQPRTVYCVRDRFDCRYIYLRLPDASHEAILSIGPYLCSVPTDLQIMEWAEGKEISLHRQKQLKNYFSSLPILVEPGQIFMLLEAFYEQLWGVNGFSVEYLENDFLPVLPSISEKAKDGDDEYSLWQMKNLEQRYAYENQLMDAVSKGQIHRVDVLTSRFSTQVFEQRVADPVRNVKNYCIIMNTLLRKAAEKGGVHPMYLDNISSGYAIKIEQIVSLKDLAPLMTEIFHAYCQLVQKHSTSKYSAPVSQALLCIDANPAGDLSLNSLSKALNISSGYLSTIFKKETGKTITDFIARRRIEQAMELLRTTRLQVQTVAQHCGIMDVHYFSKLFKKFSGLTPKEYRDSVNR